MINKIERDRLNTYLLLRRVYKKLISRITTELKSLGTTDAQFGVLRTISKKDEVSIGEISKWVLTCNANLTALIDRMERKKLVIRRIGKTDKRWRHISLTEKGNALAEKVIEPHRNYVANIFAAFTLEELDHFNSLLMKLQAVIDDGESKLF